MRLHSLYEWFFRRHRRKTVAGLALLALAYALCLPRPLFRTPVSTVLEGRRGELLGARIADDGQWRFPAMDSVPARFATALIEFEDRRFNQHPGVDPLAIGRALRQNLRAGRIVSGGSTISMQVIRLARGSRSRSLLNKLVEAILATRLELERSKRAILALYASHAPFGGNVVGLEAAAWRYFGKQPDRLSWGEAATLAVLPNSPALIHPGRNRAALLAKRDRLLDQLLERGRLDSLAWRLARAEALPEAPLPLPRLAPHLLERARAEQAADRFHSTLDRQLQQQVNDIVERHHQTLRHNEIHNLAALIIEVESGEVLAYTGNAPGAGADHAPAVDIIRARRSTGSILKPILYALMLQEGSLLPYSLVPDVPSTINGFRPENFNKDYEGLVPARRALIRSLNVPMVHMLQQYGLEKFHYELRALGLHTIDRPPGHYGLTLILGGAEATLWDIAAAYASMSRTLRHFYPYDGQYDRLDFRPPQYLLNDTPRQPVLQATPSRLDAAALWFTFEAMQQLERPDSEGRWRRFSSSRRLAWKTGTSYGFRDAWAVGVTPRHVIAVWAGNADGEGRPGLIGVQAAAPVLFDLIDLLDDGEWFRPPYDEMARISICRQSGYRALTHCPADSSWAPATSRHTAPCPYHRLIQLSSDGAWRVNRDCSQADDLQPTPWLVLPPLEEYYYKRSHPAYRPIPPWRPGCLETDPQAPPMQLIYPRYPTRIFVPVDLDGSRQRTVFQVAHRHPETTIYWHLDENYLGSTRSFHQFELNPPAGEHLLTLVDEEGQRLEQRFTIIEKQ